MKMDHAKSVIKSKSSNSAITHSKSPERNKKSWSSAQMQEAPSRQGVYIERRITVDEPHYVSPRRCSRDSSGRASRSYFDSIYATLNRDPTAPRHPYRDSLVPGKPRKIRRRIDVATVDRSTQDLDALYTNSPRRMDSPLRVRKLKYRSRVLNGNIDDKLEVLKAKTEIIHTPSYSNRDLSVRKLSEMPVADKDKSVCTEINVEVEDDPDGKKLKKGKVLRIEEPATLMSEYHTNSKKSMYNFFVDLLETTINVYKADCNMNPSLSQVSKAMEIEEAVANKLDIGKPEGSDYSRPNVFYVSRHDDRSTDKIEVYKSKPRYTHMNPPIAKQRKSMPRNMNMPPTRHTRKSVSFANDESDPPKQKKAKKKTKKRTLLDILKEELKMDEDAFDEPQSFHEALQVIAKNKRRCQRTIHFDNASMPIKTKSDDRHPCMFKRRKIISASNKSTKRNKNFRIYNPQTTFMTSILTERLPRKFSGRTKFTGSSSESETDTKTIMSKQKRYVSTHSIEVKAYDYDMNQNVREVVGKTKPRSVTREPSNENYQQLSSNPSIPSESTINTSKDFCIEGLSCQSIESRGSTTLSQLLLGTGALNLL